MKKILVILVLLFPIYINAEVVNFYKCVDGDTFKIKKKDEIITVRLLAVDTPETVHPTKEVEYYGKEASNYTCNMLTNAKKIELEYDENSDKKDKYDRLLAWVFVDDILLQDELIKNGYAEVAYLYGNYKYTALLKDHEEIAKIGNMGLWNASLEEKTTNENKTSNETTNEKDVVDVVVEKYGYFGLIGLILVLMTYSYLKKKFTKTLKKYKI